MSTPNNYVQQLEAQNEELQQKLAESDKTLDVHIKVVSFLTPVWMPYKSYGGTDQAHPDPLEGEYYLYRTPVSHVAKVYWSTDKKKWFLNMYNYEIIDGLSFEHLNQAINYVEKCYTTTIQKLDKV
jgi:hypothetical protein